MSHLNGGSSILSNHAPEPKQSQFSTSMLWGRSDLKEKFYSGESSASPWVRDLLWKANIVAEKKKLGMTGVSIESMPPHMRSVHAAKMQAEDALKLQTMERVKGEKMLQAQIQQKLQIESGGGGGGGGGANRGKLTSRSTSSGFQLPGSRHMQRSRKGAQSARRLPALNLDVLKSGGGSGKYTLVAGDTERGSRMSSTRSIRSSYSRGSSRASSRRSMRSSTSSGAVTRLASLLKSQNDQLRRGLQQQVRWCCCFVVVVVFFLFFFFSRLLLLTFFSFFLLFFFSAFISLCFSSFF